ncbi:MAG: hypothetical protein ABIP94_12805 [Planctomycetota bacterium]
MNGERTVSACCTAGRARRHDPLRGSLHESLHGSLHTSLHGSLHGSLHRVVRRSFAEAA